jgi:hypothetical protein
VPFILGTHPYNQVVVDAFVGDEDFGADMFVCLKEKMNTAVKTMHKLSRLTSRQSGMLGAPSAEKATKRTGVADYLRGSNPNKGADTRQGSEDRRRKRVPPEGNLVETLCSASSARSTGMWPMMSEQVNNLCR